jgi:hypothetical protein
MKKIFWLMLVLAFILAACQPASPVIPDTPAPLPATPVPTQALPAAEPYPAPALAAPASPGVSEVQPAYPAPGDPAAAQDVSWDQAEIEILNGNVAHAVKQNASEVVFTLKDGRVLKSVQPVEGELERLVSECGYYCEGISVRNP